MQKLGGHAGKADRENGDILLFCLGSWASAGSSVNSRPMLSVVVILVKYILPCVAAVQNVVANPSVVPGTPYLIAFDCPLWPGPLSPQPSANRLLQVTNELVATEWSAGSLVQPQQLNVFSCCFFC